MIFNNTQHQQSQFSNTRSTLVSKHFTTHCYMPEKKIYCYLVLHRIYLNHNLCMVLKNSKATYSFFETGSHSIALDALRSGLNTQRSICLP